MTAINFEHNWEMLDYGISSPESTQTDFLRSKVYLDPADFDGATYYFEVVAVNSAIAADNLQTINSSFEDDWWDQWGWVEDHSGIGTNTPTLTRTTDNAVDGSYAGRIQYTGKTGDSGGVIALTGTLTGAGTIAPGDQVAVGFNLRGVPTGCDVRIGVRWYDSAGAYVNRSFDTLTINDTGMDRYTAVSTVAPANTSQCAIGLRIEGIADGDSVDLYFDCARIEMGTTANEYTGGSSPLTVSLVNQTADPDTVAATVSVSPTTDAARFRSAAFVPTTGANNYVVRLPSTTKDSLRVYAARIVIVQVAATKTKLQFPLLNANYSVFSSANDNTVAVDSRTEATYGHTTSAYYSKWRHVAANLGTVAAGSSWEFEAILASSAAVNTVCSLCVDGDTATVLASVTSTGTTVMRYVSAFADDDADFANDAIFSCYIKGDDTNAAMLQRAALYVKLTPITKVECFLRYSFQIGAGTTAQSYGMQRLRLTTSSYSGDLVAYYSEAVGACADAANCYMPRAVISTSSLSGVDISGAGIAFASATRGWMRSAAWIPPADGRDIYRYRLATTASSSLTIAFIVVSVSVTGGGGGGSVPGLTFDAAAFDPLAFDAAATTPPEPPTPPTNPPATQTNILFDGTLRITVARAALPRTYHDFTPILLPGLSFSNTNPGGFGEATFSIAATELGAELTYVGHTMAKTDRVKITHGTTPKTLFEGQITNDVSRPTVEDGEAFYSVTAAGLWFKAGQRGDFCRTWSDPDTGRWFEKATGGPWQVDTDGKLEVKLEGGQSIKAAGTHSLYYWLDDGMGDPDDRIIGIIGISAGRTKNLVTPDVSWNARLQSSDSPWGTWTTEQSWSDLDEWTGATAEAFYIPVGASVKALRLKLEATAAIGSGEMLLDRYISLTKVAVLTSHMITYHRDQIDSVDTGSGTITMLQSLGPLTIKVGDRVFISDTAAAYDGWRKVTWGDGVAFRVGVTGAGAGAGYVFTAPTVDEAIGYIADDTGLATGSWWDYDAPAGLGNWGLEARPHMSRAEAIETLAATHPSPLDYGFWDDDSFHCYEREDPPSHGYLVDSSLPGIEFDVHADTEESPTHVKVLYSFRDVDGGDSVYPDGTLRAVYWPDEPDWGDASVVLDVWDQWADLSLETSQAEAIGKQIIAWMAANAYVGTITIATSTVPLFVGGTYATAWIRAGEYIEDANFATGPLQISSVEVDVDSGVTTLGIGENRRDFVARITGARRWQGSPLGHLGSRMPLHQTRPLRRRT